jgi:hyperosmotically inducible protein
MALKTIIFSMMLALLLSVAGCTSLTGETAGQYLDDSTITASVKAKLVAEKMANLTRVDVDKVVSLNGIVQSPDQKRRAEELTLQVSGVTRVQNNLQIQKIN